MPLFLPPPNKGRAPFGAVLGLTLAVFAGGVGFVTIQLRGGLREQVLAREGETLAAVASMQIANETARLAEIGLRSAPGDLLAAVLRAAPYRGVMGIRVFDAAGQFSAAVPWPWSEETPGPEDRALLARGLPIARLQPGDVLADVLATTRPGQVPEAALEVWVPLRRPAERLSAGSAQFLIDGSTLSRELAVLDQRLALQALLAWAAGAAVISLGLGWAFRRLDEANRELRQRGDELERANRELLLASKTSAVGTITSHLLHELKNPIASLEACVAMGQQSGGTVDAAVVADLTRRLRTAVGDVLGILRDEQGGGVDFDLTVGEVIEVVLAKRRAEAQRRQVKLDVTGASAALFPNRRASLAALVLQNLVQNALEATPDGGTVTLSVRGETGQEVEFLVQDSGSGLPPAVQERLFQPVRSGKEGGSGIGLALSQQLAQQASGRIELVGTGPTGTTFRLVLSPGG